MRHGPPKKHLASSTDPNRGRNQPVAVLAEQLLEFYRQEKALLRMFREGPEGFRGGLTAGKYSAITGASPATTTRDLVDLVAKGALVREGERRHARYRLSVPMNG